MSKKNGALFSKTFWGYKKSDVNEYILQSDRSHDDRIVLLTSERDYYEKRALEAEAKNRELESMLDLERNGAKEAIKRVSAEYESKLLAYKTAADDLRLKLSQAADKADANAERAVDAEKRAESAEAELSVLSIELESARSQIDELSRILSEKGEESKRLAELDEYVGRYALQYDEEKRSAKSSRASVSHVKKKPMLFRLVKRK